MHRLDQLFLPIFCVLDETKNKYFCLSAILRKLASKTEKYTCPYKKALNPYSYV